MTPDNPRLTAVKQKYQAAGQDHVLTFWDSLSEDEQAPFLNQLESLDPNALNSIYRKAMAASKDKATVQGLEPLARDEARSVMTASAEELCGWTSLGLEAIADGQVAVVLLAGGQGTRLGSPLPKGCYRDIGLPSHKTLFQLQAERIQKLQELARLDRAQKTQQRVESIPSVTIPWCIMTSGPTRQHTETFLREHNYFGLDVNQIFVFEQGVLPCFDPHGKILLVKKNMIATSPNGNGGLYWALYREGVLDWLQGRGVQYVHCYSVDNILIKIGDPIGIGHMVKMRADVTAKVMPKTMPTEPLGVICRQNGSIKVVEYSEMDPALAALIDAETGEFVFRAGNICNQSYTLDFLKRLPAILQDQEQDALLYHVASKKIPHINLETGHRINPEAPNGVKLELFVFDVFPMANRFACLEVERSREFSPMKNAHGLDSPSTARQDLERLHLRWIEEAGGRVVAQSKNMQFTTDGTSDTRLGLEIGPTMSYAGEGLEWIRGKTIRAGAFETKEDVEFVQEP
ncbi:UDP-N-acetylglucosamine pyrophosphorylase [Lunasporangiospora selenospora]|uniref:UDP-N-acetylglucosamine diphosphorylase n=1 Tax=Lunasporangiospora selenospora TaxID=979761 RepID=A0A9P6KEJ8_9FUNG|nr:UDP-N-acetylglucosamine pyrophosphorylase [Lunasporangiospora selenospora]